MVRTLLREARVPRLARLATLLVAVTVGTVAVGNAHDFWIIPDMFAVDSNAMLHVNARQGGGKFPDGSAVEAARVVDARVIGATGTTKVVDMAVEGASLRLHQKPTADGQYLIVVGLATRVFRETPTGVLRFLRAEGGAAEAARLEREQSMAGLDSVIFTGISYAATVAQVGSDGPRAYDKQAGLTLEFVAQNDPGHLHVGDTLHVQLVSRGKPLAGLGLELAYGIDPAMASTTNVSRLAFTTDANGVAHLPLLQDGPVMLRSAYASPTMGGAAREWDVSRTTYVFHVGASH